MCLLKPRALGYAEQGRLSQSHLTQELDLVTGYVECGFPFVPGGKFLSV